MTPCPTAAFSFFRSACVLAALAVVLGCADDKPAQPDLMMPELRIIVMDPLALALSCDCVEGYAQRQYDLLAEFLTKKLSKPVQVVFGEGLEEVMGRGYGEFHLVIGKRSVVESDATDMKWSLRPILALTDKDGSTTFRGQFTVRADDPAKTIADLGGRRFRFGPPESEEKYGAALSALARAGVERPEKIVTSPGCSAAAVEVVEKDADVAVISSYAIALLEGCDTIDKGDLRVVGVTRDVPFIAVFATEHLPEVVTGKVVDAFLAVAEDKALLVKMESKHGFVRLNDEGTGGEGWTDWMGPRRDAKSNSVPRTLPKDSKPLWKHPLTGNSVGGIAATDKYVVLSDKNKAADEDVWRCLDALTGKEIWQVRYAAAGEMDYTNSPRATPVIAGDRVILLGAFGHLLCVELETGDELWRANLVDDFGAEVPMWGFCSTPLVVDGNVIVNPGAKDASVVALEVDSGNTAWISPGDPPGYAAFILGTFGGVRQIVGYDAVSLGGWDPATGKRLWKHMPELNDDLNVATPVAVGGKLLLSTENNATRLHEFDTNGRIKPKPVAVNKDVLPDTATPVVYEGLIFCVAEKLYCLDDKLRTLWSVDDERFENYAAFIAGNGRILISTIPSELVLIEPNPKRLVINSTLKPFAPKSEVWSYPALVGTRLYLRNQNSIICLQLD